MEEADTPPEPDGDEPELDARITDCQVLDDVVVQNSAQSSSEDFEWSAPLETPAAASLPEQLSKCSYLDTLRASLLVAAVLLAGAVLLGLSEEGVFGDGAGELATRFAGCILLFYYPIVTGLTEVRCLALGIQPVDGLQVIWQPTYSPPVWRRVAQERGVPERRAACLPVVFHIIILVALFCLVCLPLHPTDHALGLVFVYLVTILGAMLVNGILQRKVLPFLDHNYCMRSGMMLAISLAGFIAITVFCCSLRPHVRGAFGLAMPMLATFFEHVGTMAIGMSYDKHFVQHPGVVQKFAATQQSMYPSCCIALLAASAHSARLTVLLSHALQDPSSQAWAFSLSATLVLAVPVRLGYMQKFWQRVTCGRLRFTVYKMIMLSSQYQMGYPRFLAVGVVALARAIIGKPLAPSAALGWVTLFALLEEVIEDIVVAICETMGMMAEFQTEEENKVDLEKVVPSASDDVPVVGAWPSTSLSTAARTLTAEDPATRTAEDPVTRKQLFTYGIHRPASKLPFWAHFTACSISMYHTLLFLFLLGGGTSFVLGVCSQESASGMGRGILLWPMGVDSCVAAA